jgi:hypothetical protein
MITEDRLQEALTALEILDTAPEAGSTASRGWCNASSTCRW